MTVKKKEMLKLELLGIGSISHRKLKARLLEALEALSLNVPILEVSEIDKLMKYDISGIPALVIDGNVIFEKVVPDVEDLKIILGTLLRTKDRDFPVHHVLVPTDFTETSENAFQFALALARQEKADLKIVHVQPPRLDLSNPYKIDATIADEQAREELFKAIPEENSEETDKVRIDKLMISGYAVEELVNLTKAKEADLMVMGARQEAGLLEKWFGSISSEVARLAFCPVLLVPRQSRFSGFRNIVYASDFHPSEETVLPRLLNFAARYKATVHFVHVEENKLNGYLVDSTGSGKIFKMGESSLKMSVIECDDVLSGLNRYASEHHADLLAMTTSHRNFFEKLFHKSMTKKMVFNTEIPLLVLHFDD